MTRLVVGGLVLAALLSFYATFVSIGPMEARIASAETVIDEQRGSIRLLELGFTEIKTNLTAISKAVERIERKLESR